MSDYEKIAVGKEVESLEVSPQFDAYSGVVIVDSEGNEELVGTDTGRTITIPGITRTQAQTILSDLTQSGFQYQPYTASGALLNPAAELGDGVSINGTYSGIYKMSRNYSPLMTADIEAPQDEEIDHEYPYEPKQDRIFKREIAQAFTRISQTEDAITLEAQRATSAEGNLSSRITQNASSITSEVNARKNADTNLSTRITQNANSITSEVTRATKAEGTLRSSIDQNADSISAKVSKTGGSSSTFGWNLTNSSWTVSGNGKTIFKVTNAGAEVTGKITATSGKIGAFDITTSYISTNGKTSRDDTTKDGVYIGSNGIALGKGNFRVGSDGVVAIGGNNFRVDANGNVRANNMTLTGTLNVGGTNITAAALRAGAQSAYSNGGTWSTGAGYGYNYNNATKSGTTQYPSLFRCGTLTASQINTSGITGSGPNYFYGSTTLAGNVYIAGSSGRVYWRTITVNGVSMYVLSC